MDRVSNALGKISEAVQPFTAECMPTVAHVPLSFRVVGPNGASHLVVRVYGGARELPLATTRQIDSVVAMVRRRLLDRGLLLAS